MFPTRIVQSFYFLNLKSHASSHLLWLYSLVCLGPGWKPQRPVFSQRGSFASALECVIIRSVIKGLKGTIESVDFGSFQELVSGFTRIHAFTYCPFSGASWAHKLLFLGALGHSVSSVSLSVVQVNK